MSRLRALADSPKPEHRAASVPASKSGGPRPQLHSRRSILRRRLAAMAKAAAALAGSPA